MIQTALHRRYPGAMIYEPEFADQARIMCRLGATDEELAEHFEVCVRTIYRWRNTHEAFAEAVVAGKEHADARVERALYSRAVGCTVERTKVFKSAGEDPVYATYQHHLPPDTNAALHWLRVRQPKKWRMAEKEEEMSESRKALTEFVRRCEARDEEKRLARQREQPPPPPPPSPEPVAMEPYPAPDPDMRPADDPAPEPCLCPASDADPASPSEPSPAPAPAPRPLFERFPRPGGGYGPPLPPPAAAPKPAFMPIPRFERGGYR